MKQQKIILKKVQVHNLKQVDLTLQPNQLIVFTGVSGSGKSSLVFDTIYVEGQRRYIESLSIYARRHLGNLPKPQAEHISGISPTIAIEQKSISNNPRSTVGTITGIYDFFRVLYARIGEAHCPVSKEPLKPQTPDRIIRNIESRRENTKIMILAPYARGKKGEFKEDFHALQRQGFLRARLDGHFIDLSEDIRIDGNLPHDMDIVIDRLKISPSNSFRIKEAVSTALEMGDGLLILIDLETSAEQLFSTHAYSSKSKLSYPPLQPHDFSFNHPEGMCQTCHGLGIAEDFDLDRIIDPEKSIAEDCCEIAGSYRTVKWGNIYRNLAKIYKFRVDTPWKDLSKKAKHVFLYGVDQKWIKMIFTHPDKNKSWIEYVPWHGVLHEAKKRYAEAKSEKYREYFHSLMTTGICPDCRGSRIRPYPGETKLGGLKIHELSSMTIAQILQFFENLVLDPEDLYIGKEVIKEIIRRLNFLLNVGLHYLALDRTSPTLSGGESQRVRLASQIGSGLVGTTYILDEPSIGLHPRDNKKLIETLKQLRDKGNTVIVVEHDEETILHADEIVDIGPGAGDQGGEIVAKGQFADILDAPRSLTGAFLSRKQRIPIPKKRRRAKNHLWIKGASHHNLKNIDVKIPLEVFLAITGVSGSGKSSLISDILYPALAGRLHKSKLQPGRHKAIEGWEHIDKIIAIDQSPIGRTPRSNPATYIKLFDDIRDLFAKLPVSQAEGFQAGRFSFNVKEGSCPECKGLGEIRIDMDFLEDQYRVCPLCEGKRFDKKTLSVTYKEKNIHDILQMTIKDALEFFSSVPHIEGKLGLLAKVGLDYLTLGQPSTTLSGGEAQRIKLAKELVRPDTGKTLYILDEPTTGLHFADSRKLIEILQDLVGKGNTVAVIEHHMDLVKTVDYVLDLGPEGGEGGGRIIGEGTPEQLAKKDTPTGRALKEALSETLSLPEKPSIAPDSFTKSIEIVKAAQNNLKDVSLQIPHGKITVCTGPSGSGKTSLAFETIYAEGQRRYIESLSSYARQFVKQMPKPKIESLEGLAPAIAIEQKKHAGNPRSTIGTMTEVYDYLRILYAVRGTAYCPETGEKIQTISREFVQKELLKLPEKTKVQILSPLQIKRSDSFDKIVQKLQKEGFLRIRLNGTYYEIDEEIPYDRNLKNELLIVIDRLIIKPGIEKRLYDAIDTAVSYSKGIIIADIEGKDRFFNLAFAVPSTGKSYPEITPHTFSFNTEEGMCPDCQGLGFVYGSSLQFNPSILSHSIMDLATLLWKEIADRKAYALFLKWLKEEDLDPDSPLFTFSKEDLLKIFEGSEKPVPYNGSRFLWRGINNVFSLLAKAGTSDYRSFVLPLLDKQTCFSCQGSRLNPLARNVRIKNMSLPQLCSCSISDALAFIRTLTKPSSIIDETLTQIYRRLNFLCEIGLDYLSLERSAPTLSGGETQRITLARQLGSGLTGCLYVLDEPTIGLHPHNNALLNKALRHLCDLGNTLILVEHDPLTIQTADYLVDFGPKAGKEGGLVIAEGTIEHIRKNPDSLTGKYLSGKKTIPIPKERRKGKGSIQILNASLHNLKGIDVQIPTNAFTCITGVSGSGKSTLMHDILKPAIKNALSAKEKKSTFQYMNSQISGFEEFEKVIAIDQSPIGHTIRADISTYADLLTPLRYFFASLPEAKARGLQPKNFSYNHRKGMCTKCWGLGFRTIDLQFLPSVAMTCDGCQGNRLNPLSLSVTYRGKNLGQLLQYTVKEAMDFLPEHPKIQKILEMLCKVGISYLQLGQALSSLSGGEAQRLRLAKELLRRSRGKDLYLFDEPTIGLHSEDIRHLLPIFHELVKKGHTLVMIEHNLDVIANADYIIDLGPEAGEKGGEIVAAGTPEEIAAHPASRTAEYLKFLRK